MTPSRRLHRARDAWTLVRGGAPSLPLSLHSLPPSRHSPPSLRALSAEVTDVRSRGLLVGLDFSLYSLDIVRRGAILVVDGGALSAIACARGSRVVRGESLKCALVLRPDASSGILRGLRNTRNILLSR